MELASLVIAIIVGTLVARQIIPRVSDTPGANRSKRLAQLAAPFVSFLAVLIAFLMMGHGEQIFHASINEFGLHMTQLLVSITIIGIGVAAYFFKRWNQGLYGLVEMVFAAAAVFGVARTLTPQRLLLAQWATLGGFAYVVARGWGNVWDYRQTMRPNKDDTRHRPLAAGHHATLSAISRTEAKSSVHQKGDGATPT
jgi:hypothetical protein